MPEEAIQDAMSLLNPCRVCPRQCRVNRLAGELGFCLVGQRPRVISSGAHFGEESVLVGPGGSGTIFFQGCNLNCVFCQNWNISRGIDGRQLSAEQLAQVMLELQRHGCGNINLVTPTHVAPQLMAAIDQARRQGLRLPIVYNCSGYDSVEMLSLLEGFIDIYMPDFKFSTPWAGEKYAAAADYPAVASQALAEMYRQVGPLKLDTRELAARGVLVRHLVMPTDVAGSEQVLGLVAAAAPGCAINIMGQWRPCHRAAQFPELLIGVHDQRVSQLRKLARELGLVRVDDSASD